MLDERTAEVAATSRPTEPAISRTLVKLSLLEGFFEKFIDLPEPSLTVHPEGMDVSLQLPEDIAGPRERCLAVARIAQELRGTTRLVAVSDWWSFMTDVGFGGLHIHVYAPLHREDA
ncbi:hypothetical protein [Streptomyces sp. cg36]|uniref:hypothetical protein n=1 Tax=Streptomyces sp. cg36 TaxID=3238798 RepID=UPI0034E2285A